MARFTYQLTIRPAGVDTTPVGVGREIHDTDLLAMARNYGSVSYAEPLTTEEIAQYALLPVTQMRALNGKEFTQSFLGLHYRYLVTLSTNFKALIVQTSQAGRIVGVDYLSWADYVKRSKNWKPAFEYLTLGEPLPAVTPCPSGRNDCPSGCPSCPADCAAAPTKEGGQSK